MGRHTARHKVLVVLITSVGWGWQFPHGVSLGAEAIGEDLEGFWATH